MPKRKSRAVYDYFDDIKVDDRRVWRCLLCQETRDFKGNTSNLGSHLAKSKDEQHIEAHNSIKDKCQPPRKKTTTADNVPERLMDHETDVENDEREDSNPVPSTSASTCGTSISSNNSASASTSKKYY